VKPFHMEELVARLRAVIRRSNGLAGAAITFGEYTLNTRLMQLTREGIPIELTPQEYKTLAYLAFHRGQVVSQLELTEHLYQQDFERSSNSIEVLVGRLRRRLGSDIIKTRRGFGYYIEAGA
jgi:two-component system, OmpR family, response regulator